MGAGRAHAHKPSDSYLTIDANRRDGFSGRWDIALRDLDFALGLDADGDGAITWGEVRAKHADIAAYALARLALAAPASRPAASRSARSMLDEPHRRRVLGAALAIALPAHRPRSSASATRCSPTSTRSTAAC